MRLEKARGPSAAAREGERGRKMRGGGRTRNPILGKFHYLECGHIQLDLQFKIHKLIMQNRNY